MAIDDLEEIEILYALLPQFWNQGYAIEMVEEFIRLADNDFKLKSVVAITLPDNISSTTILENAGFVYEREILHGGLEQQLYRYQCITETEKTNNP